MIRFRSVLRLLSGLLRKAAVVAQSPPRVLRVTWYVYWYRWLLQVLLDHFRLGLRLTVNVDSKTGKKGSPLQNGIPSLASQDYEQKILGKLCTPVVRWKIVKVFCVIVALLAILQIANVFLERSGLRRHVDPHAIRGYPYCPVNKSLIKDYAVKYVCDFDPQPNPDVDVIIITFVNSAWITLAKNWVCSAEKVGLKEHLFLVSFESGVCSSFKSDGVRCYEHTKVIPGTVFGEPDYQKLVIERTRLVLKLLNCGQRILMADADISFLQNPLDVLKDLTVKKDVVFQADSSGVGFVDVWLHYVFRYICGGFIYMKPTAATKQLWLSVLKYQTDYKWNDQAGLNICIRHHSHNISWDTLDAKRFPNGKQFFHYRERSDKSMIVHANHLIDTNKIAHMIAARVWCYDPVAVEFCKNTTLFSEQCLKPSPTPLWCFDYRYVCFVKYNVGSLI